MTTIQYATRTIFWTRECEYICRTTAIEGNVRNMNYDKMTFIRYCEMQKACAERESRGDVVQYIQHCLDDLAD